MDSLYFPFKEEKLFSEWKNGIFEIKEHSICCYNSKFEQTQGRPHFALQLDQLIVERLPGIKNHPQVIRLINLDNSKKIKKIIVASFAEESSIKSFLVFKNQILAGLEEIKKTFHFQKAEESSNVLGGILDVPKIGSKLFSSTAEVIKSASSNPGFGTDFSKKALYLLADKKVEKWDEKDVVTWLESIDDPFPEDESDDSSTSDPITNIKKEAEGNASNSSSNSSPANPSILATSPPVSIPVLSKSLGNSNTASSSPVITNLPTAAEAKDKAGQLVFPKKAKKRTLKDKFEELILANDINGMVLLTLEDSALIELGVAEAQKRYLLLKHIAKLKTTGKMSLPSQLLMRKLNKFRPEILHKSFVKDFDEYFKALSIEADMKERYLTYEKPDKESFQKFWFENSSVNNIELFGKDLEYDNLMSMKPSQVGIEISLVLTEINLFPADDPDVTIEQLLSPYAFHIPYRKPKTKTELQEIKDRPFKLFCGVIVGPWFLQWVSPGGIVIPKRIGSTIRSFFNMSSSIGIIEQPITAVQQNLAHFLTYWNKFHKFEKTNQKVFKLNNLDYDHSRPYKRKGNQMNFVDSILIFLGLRDFKIGKCLKDMLSTLRKDGEINYQLPHSLTFKPSHRFFNTMINPLFKLTKTEIENDYFSEDGPSEKAPKKDPNQKVIISEQFLTEDFKKKIAEIKIEQKSTDNEVTQFYFTFSSHEQLDCFISFIINAPKRNNDPIGYYRNVLKRFTSERTILACFDRAFWFRSYCYPQIKEYRPSFSKEGSGLMLSGKGDCSCPLDHQGK